MKRLLKALFISVFVVLLVAACSNNESESDSYTDEEVKELVHKYSTENIEDETASITSEELIITDQAGDETKIPLPKDEFFVSIAPFYTETHECAIHSLTGCQGELVQESFDIYITDESGSVVMDDEIETAANGFIDLWLDKDENYTVTISQDGKEVTSDISTFEGDYTCITTMQLT